MTTSTTTRKLYFTIHGEWLTNFCRSRWADEDEPFHAVKVLTSAFPEFSMQRIFQILTGSLKLAGKSSGPDSDMHLEDDNVTVSEHGNLLSFSDVMSKTLTRMIDKAAEKRLAEPLRLLSIAIEEEDERRRDQRVRMAIQFADQSVAEPKLDSFRIGGALVPREILKDPNAMFFMQYMGATAETVKPEPGPLKGNWCGWIKKDGVFFPCKYFQHDALADALGYKNGDEMLKQGWVKVQEANQGLIKKPADLYWHTKPTQSQIDTIWDWCKDNNREFPKDQLDEYQDHP